MVGVSWLTDCMRHKVRQDESAHTPPPHRPLPSAPAAPPDNPQAPTNPPPHNQPEQQLQFGDRMVDGAGSGGSDPNKSNPLNPEKDLNPRSPPSTTPSYFFLPWVRLHLVGCTREEMREAARLCSECGAVREPEVHPEITHVLVGSQPSLSQLSHLRDHLATWAHCLAIKMQWLQVKS